MVMNNSDKSDRLLAIFFRAMRGEDLSVKDIADEITDDNEHDGIAKSLYKHIPQLHTFD